MTEDRGLSRVGQPAPERLIWPWMIGIASISLGGKDFLNSLTWLANFFPGTGFSWVWVGESSEFGVPQKADVAIQLALPALEVLAGLALLKWRKPVLLVVYALTAICWTIVYQSYWGYRVLESRDYLSMPVMEILMHVLYQAINLVFPVLLVFWYYTGRPSRQLRLWRAGAA